MDEDKFSHRLEKKAERESGALLFWVFFISIFVGLYSSLFLVSRKDVVQTATPPPVINYQGKLLRDGASVTTAQNMGFLLFDASTNGNLLYTAAGTLAATTTLSITPTSGIFSVDLGTGSTNSIPTSTFANNHTLYLEVQVGGAVLSPRKRVTAVPYAINSEYLSGLSATTTSGTEYIPRANEFGNFIFTGNARGTSVGDGLLYLNPSSTIANATLLGLAVGGSERFRVDEDGDAFITGGLLTTASSTFSNSLNVAGNLNASSTLFIGGSILPGANNNSALGAYGTAFTNLFASNTLYVGSISNSSTLSGNLLALGSANASTTLLQSDTLVIGAGTSTAYNRGVFWVDASAAGNGAVFTSGTLRTNGLATLSGGFQSTASSTVGSSLVVSGSLGASSTLLATGLSTLYGGFLSNASSSIGSILSITGATTVSSTLSVSGLATLSGGFISTASSSINSSLNVAGNLNASSTLFVNGTIINPEATTTTIRSQTFTNALVISDFSRRVGIGTSTPFATLSVSTTVGQYALAIGSPTTTYMVIDHAGQLAIGQGNPVSGFPLTVNRPAEGDLALFTVDGSGRHRFSSDSSTNALIRTLNNVDLRLGVNEDAIIIKNGGRVGVNSTTPWGQLAVSSSYYRPSFAISSSTDTLLIVDAIGNVGLNIINPDRNARLHVSGGILATASSTFSNSLNVAGNLNASSTLFVGGALTMTGGSAADNELRTAAFDNALYISDANRRVGIGTSTPFATLSVSTTGGMAGFVVGSSTKTHFIVDRSGSVGIGTDAPAGTGGLEIVNLTGGGTPANYLQVTGATANNSNYPFVSLKGGTFVDSYPNIQLSNGGLALSLQSGEHSTDYNNLMGIILGAQASAGASYIQFLREGSEFARVTGDGNWGFNSTAPDRALEINTSTGNALRLTYNDSDGSATNYADFLMASDGALSITTAGTDEDITIQGGTFRNALFIDDSSSRVGIGTSTPFATLSVSTTAGVPSFVIGSSTATHLIVDASGRLGINTSSTLNADLHLKSVSTLFETGSGARGIFSLGRNVYYDGANFRRVLLDNDAPLLQLADDGTFQFWTESDANTAADSAITYALRFTVPNEGGFISAASSSINSSLNVAGNLNASSTLFIGGSILPGANNNSDLGIYGAAFRSLYASTTLFVGGAGTQVSLDSNSLDSQGPLTLQTTGAQDLVLQTGGYANALFIDDSTNRVGIASSTPYGVFSVEMNATSPAFVVGNTGSSSPALFVDHTINDGGVRIGTTGLAADKARLQVVGPGNRIMYLDANEPAANGNIVRLRFRMKDDDDLAGDTSFSDYGYLEVESTDIVNTSRDTRWNFSGWGNNSFSNWLTLSSGNVGIGTSTPFATLSISTTGGTAGFVVGSSTATYLIVDSNGRFGINSTTPWGDSSVEIDTNGNPAFVVANSVSSSPAFMVDSAVGKGWIGMGTTTPKAALHIEGANDDLKSATIRLDTTDNDYGAIIEFQDASPGQTRQMALNFRNGANSAQGQVAYVNGTDQLTFRTSGSDDVFLDTQGDFGIASSTCGFDLCVGNSGIDSGGTTFTNTSHSSFKENIVRSTFSANFLDKFSGVYVRNYQYKDDYINSLLDSFNREGPRPPTTTDAKFLRWKEVQQGILADEFNPLINKSSDTATISGADRFNVMWEAIRQLIGQVKDIQSADLGNSLQGNLEGNLNTDQLVARDATFTGRITVRGHAVFDKDTVGQARILAGAEAVRVRFVEEYAEQPVITATPRGAVLGHNFQYSVSDESTTGFTIQIFPKQPGAVEFNWHAFGSSNGRITVSDGTTEAIVPRVGEPASTDAAPAADEPIVASVNEATSTASVTSTTLITSSTPVTSATTTIFTPTTTLPETTTTTLSSVF